MSKFRASISKYTTLVSLISSAEICTTGKRKIKKFNQETLQSFACTLSMKETVVTNLSLSCTYVAFEDRLRGNQKCYLVPDNTCKNKESFFPHKPLIYRNGALSCWLSLLQFQWSGEHRAGHNLGLEDKQ